MPSLRSVYFVLSPSLARIKIGCSRSSPDRIEDFRTGSPDRLVLLGHTPGGHDLERRVHKQFDDLRIHGEWFNLDKNLARYISANTFKYPKDVNSIFKTEPRLLDLWANSLYQHITAARSRRYCANDYWHYGDAKNDLTYLVGWYAQQEALHTTKAYDIAYETIYNLLPGCHGCHCVSIADLAYPYATLNEMSQ
jgi:hypothetical protein